MMGVAFGKHKERLQNLESTHEEPIEFLLSRCVVSASISPSLHFAVSVVSFAYTQPGSFRI